MDDSLQELYQDIILDHNRHPRNCMVLDECSTFHDGYNPTCGDRVRVYINFENGLITDVCFHGEGCTISQASASLMTELLKNKTKDEASIIIDDVCSCIAGESIDLTKYGDVAALIGVRHFPMRIKCATLAWHAAKLALETLT